MACFFFYIYSTNTTLDKKNFQVSYEEAEEVVNQTPPHEIGEPDDDSGETFSKFTFYISIYFFVNQF